MKYNLLSFIFFSLLSSFSLASESSLNRTCFDNDLRVLAEIKLDEAYPVDSLQAAGMLSTESLRAGQPYLFAFTSEEWQALFDSKLDFSVEPLACTKLKADEEKCIFYEGAITVRNGPVLAY